MNLTMAAVALLAISTAGCIRENAMAASESKARPSTPAQADIRAVSPALEQYQQALLQGDLWKRPDLSPRDRSIITLAALIARNQSVEMSYHVHLALDNGVKASEVSEIITHLAFYSGWANAMSAVVVTKEIFHERGITSDQLPRAKGGLLPLD
jgi:4-carboxymuconolactone decarboxylase